MAEFLMKIAPYRELFLIIGEVLIVYCLILFGINLYREWKRGKEEAYFYGDQHRLKHDFDGDMDEMDRQNAIRQMLANDGVDPSANTYLGVSDGGREVYERSVTISRMPKTVRFAESFQELFAYPGQTHSVFVEPVDNETVSRTIDRHINVLESEAIGAEGQTNRVRKLGSQIRKTERWAHEVESDTKKFFYAGFLFTFHADSVEKLNRITDEFRALALKKKMDISNCYACQSEAFLANLPLNRMGHKLFKKIGSDCVKVFLVDQNALSTIMNYTSDHFTHRKGIPLGRNLFNSQPFLFDLYDPSHFGYTLVIAGKTNSGKSATIKMMIERYVPQGYRFVIIDSQQRKGTSEGEYTSSAEVNGGVSYQVSSKSGNILNPFDVQESIEFVKKTATSGYERRTLDLNEAITDIVYIIRVLIRGNMANKTSNSDGELDVVMDSAIGDIITSVVKELYEDLEIYHGDADSLYEEGTVVKNGVLQTGIVPKPLPTLSDFYLKLLSKRSENTDADLDSVYRFIANNLKENIRELYYTDDGDGFTREEFEALEVNPERPAERMWNGKPVYALKGIKPYYDGQSTFAISRDYPVTTIDISQLKSEAERRPARNIALHLVDVGFIKKNSENLDSADKLVVIIDEAHESFVDPSARILLANEVRTARKLNVGLVFATQTVSEYSRYDETKDILQQAAVKMVFKQDVEELEELTKPLNITENQARIIRDRLGVSVNQDDPEEASRHRGEMCVIDNGRVVFVKVDYLRKTESLSVETDASTVITARKAAN